MILSTQGFREIIVSPTKKRNTTNPSSTKSKFELKKLLSEGHIEKLLNSSDQFFISPIVITVKKDQSIKIALDSKFLNKAINKKKYQMPNIDSLIQTISQTLSNTPQETA